MHEGLRDFSCPNCKAAFGAKQTAEKHILKCATNSFLLQRGPKFLSIVSDKEWKIENGGSCLYPIYQTASQIFCNNESTNFSRNWDCLFTLTVNVNHNIQFLRKKL